MAVATVQGGTQQHTTMRKRIESLSPEKQRLLALRLGIVAEAHPSTGQKLVAFVTSPAAEDNTVDSINCALRDQLPRYMVPSEVIVLDAMPRTPNGKLDRAALRAATAGTSPRTPPTTPDATDTSPENAVMRKLQGIWCDLLGIPTVGLDDDFFEIGGHSLLAVRLLAQVKAAFDADVPVSLVLTAPTVRKLAEHLQQQAQAPHKSLITVIEHDGDGAPLYCFPVHRLGVTPYRFLREPFAGVRPVHGFEAPTEHEAFSSVEALASMFVDELLRVQPKGPYYLGGMSIAGLIAYEVARQLNERGVTDVEVILFDTYVEQGSQKLGRVKGLQNWLGTTAQRFARGDVNRAQYAGDVIWQVSELVKVMARRLNRRAAKQFNLPTPAKPIYDFDEWDKLARMSDDYFSQPRQHTGNLTLYRATLSPWTSTQGDTLGWEALTDGNIYVECVRGDHINLLQARFVGDVGARLVKRLAQLDEQYNAQRDDEDNEA